MSRKYGYTYPRTIDPSLIEIGDTIMVTHHKQNGVELTVKGKVAYMVDEGKNRTLYTIEHGTLLSYEIGRPKAVLILLLRKEEFKQLTLPFFANDDEELRARIA